MKKLFNIFIVMLLMLCTSTTDASAQGFLNKLKKTAESVTSTVTDVVGDTASSGAVLDSATFNKALPEFKFKKIQVTDENGNIETNDDGTPRYRVFIYDKNDSIIAPEMAKKQIKSVLNSSITKTLIKTAAGTVIGGLTGKGKGALTGAVAGLALSTNDIINIVKQVKKLRAFNKQIDAYQAAFTSEGLPVDGTTDVSNIKGVNLDEAEEATIAAAIVKEQCEKANDMADGDWDFDAVLKASASTDNTADATAEQS